MKGEALSVMNVANSNQGYSVFCRNKVTLKTTKPPKRKVQFHTHFIENNVRFLKKLLIVEEDF